MVAMCYDDGETDAKENRPIMLVAAPSIAPSANRSHNSRIG